MSIPSEHLYHTLGLTQDMSAYYLRAPQEYWQALGIKQAPYNDDTGEYDFIHGFFTSISELSNFADILVSKLASDGILWISWPKVSASTDITDSISQTFVREVFLSHGLIDTKVCDVTDAWLGMKFVWQNN